LKNVILSYNADQHELYLVARHCSAQARMPFLFSMMFILTEMRNITVFCIYFSFLATNTGY